MKEILYMIGQGFGVVTIILGFINFQMKTREKVLYVHITTSACFAIHYMLIGAYAGMTLNLIAVVRNIIYYNTGKGGKVSKVWAITFACIMAVMGIISWENWYSVFMLLGLVVNSYAMSFSNANNIRKSILISSPLVIAYDVFVHSYGGIVFETVVIISSIIGIIRFKKNKSN